MSILLYIGGGVALILFGVRFLRKGLDRILGTRLAQWLTKLAENRFRAFATGLGLAMLAPSSTTMSVLAVQTVQAGQLNYRRMLAVVFGADVGLTMMVLLISLRVDEFAPWLALVGVVMFQFTRRTKTRGFGQIILALAFIFMGIGIIKGAAAGIDPEGDLIQIIRILERHGLLLAVLAVGLAVGLQSVTAAIGLVIGLGAAEVITLETAVMVVIGANVGVGFTTLMVGWSRIESRRLALGNLIAKSATAIIWLACAPWIASGLEALPGTVEMRVAYAHIAFNLTLAILCLPFLGLILRLAEHLAPQPDDVAEAFGPRYIKLGSIDNPSLALGQARREVLRVSEMVRGMLADLWQALKSDDARLARQAAIRDDQVDQLDRAIKKFLCHFDWDEENVGEQARLLRYSSELETIGDLLDKNVSELVLKKIRLNLTFSQKGWKELEEFKDMVTENMVIAETALATGDRDLAGQLVRNKRRVDEIARELRDNHFERLKQGQTEARETSSIHLDLITYLRHINAHVSHVAFAIAQSNDENGDAPTQTSAV